MSGGEPDAAAYCRAIEAHLCRRNEGHLIRIVGPAFEQVCGWAARGVPLKVAFSGIDRYVERYYAKGPQRRPVRIEFCEADVLDAFDDWRRALGLTTAALTGSETASEEEEPARRHGSLATHLDRVIARLTNVRAGADRTLDEVCDAIVRELDGARARAKGIRGDARRDLLERLDALDRTLIEAARERLEPETLQAIAADADADLAPFRGRMAAEDYERSRAASIDRLVREHLRLPIVSHGG